jgi:zinc-ribbon domain
MFCSQCGKYLPNDARFCQSCGRPIVPAEMALEHEIQPKAVERKPLPVEKTEVADEPKPKKDWASRWARLGIFLSVALASAILAAVVFFKGNPSAADLTEKLTSASLKLGLAAWAVSEVVAGRWLTLKRTWIAAIALYSIAFVSMAVFLGKPLATKLAELNEEQTQLDRRFAESATGKTLLQPASLASPQVAATSLAEFEQYADATERLNKRKEELLLQRDDPSFRDRWAAYFEATRVVVSATEELYRFAAEPSRQVHVENGVVIVAGPDEYNRRIDAANDAMDKLRLASAALKQRERDR